MKKSLVLAMAMALGVTASAYAANPFSDVPAGHWAYDSVAKLAAAGVVDGYADGAFDGDKLMTRYEMAQIVAKAMAKGANVDKLAAEFADELDTLGVRVAKLEKGADNVKITGQLRADYRMQDGADTTKLRTRLWIQGQVNEDWTATAMVQNQQNIKADGGDEETQLKRIYVDGRVGGLDVHAGRWDECTSTANILDAYLDGVKVSYGKDVKVWAMAASGINDDNQWCTLTEKSNNRLYVAGVEAPVGAFDAYFNFFHADSAEYNVSAAPGGLAKAFGEKEIYNIGFGVDVAKDLRLGYEYMWGDKKYEKSVSKDGFVARLDYKGADAAAPGSYGIHAQWFDQPVNCFLSPTTDAAIFADGYEGWNVGVDYTLAKNIQLCVNYYDTEAIKLAEDDEVLYTELYFFF